MTGGNIYIMCVCDIHICNVCVCDSWQVVLLFYIYIYLCVATWQVSCIYGNLSNVTNTKQKFGNISMSYKWNIKYILCFIIYMCIYTYVYTHTHTHEYNTSNIHLQNFFEHTNTMPRTYVTSSDRLWLLSLKYLRVHYISIRQNE